MGLNIQTGKSKITAVLISDKFWIQNFPSLA